MNCKDPASRLVRWRLKLLEYDYEIKYTSGKTITNADALSRPVLFLANDVESNFPSFENFQLYHQQTLDIMPPIADRDPINKIRNLVIRISQDLSDTNRHVNYAKQNFPDLEKTR